MASQDQERHIEEWSRGFCRRAGESAATVHRLTESGTVDLLGSQSSVVATPEAELRYPSIIGSVRSLGRTVRVASGLDRAGDIPVGVGVGELAIAETGSVLVSETRIEDRFVALFAEHLFLIVRSDALRPNLEDAAHWMEGRSHHGSYTCLMTGPSRTADIERSLTIGVQGPSRLDVILLS